MANDKDSSKYDHYQRKATGAGGVSSAVYGLGFIGAAIYYFGHATTFWVGVLGFFKALVWPAMLVYKLLEFLTM